MSSITSPGQAGAHAARGLLAALAGAGLRRDRAAAAAGDVPGGRSGQPAETTDQFHAASGRTAATSVAGLRDLGAG